MHSSRFLGLYSPEEHVVGHGIYSGRLIFMFAVGSIPSLLFCELVIIPAVCKLLEGRDVSGI